MQRPPARKKTGTPYWVRFALVMMGFGGFTSAFVLVVLPKRFILQSGLVESGITFETEGLPFMSPERGLDIRPTFPRTELVDASTGLGPSESFWASVLPLLTNEEYSAALPLFARYLDEFPNDVDVKREYAVTLIRAGIPDQAEALYRELIALGHPEYGMDLADLLRGRGDLSGAVEAYRDILVSNPSDYQARLALARTLRWAERYEEAIVEYRRLALQRRSDTAVRFELAQALYWSGLPIDAFSLLLGFPSHDSAWTQVAELLVELTPQATPAVLSLEEQIRIAIDEGRLLEASGLYRRLLARRPPDSDVWFGWIDFLQYEMEDLESARSALMDRSRVVGLSPEQRFRLAQLHLWTGNDSDAHVELEGLLKQSPDNGEAWLLLGDLRRWEGDLIGAQEAYKRALVFSEGNTDALAGLRAIREQVEASIAVRDPSTVDPFVSYFGDTDDFTRLDVGVFGSKQWYTTGIVFRAGYRQLEGPRVGTLSDSDGGPFFNLEMVRWWRLGAIRTSVSAGLERLEGFGEEPVINASIEVPNANGTAFQFQYSHGPAYPHTATLQSALSGVRSDDIQLSAYRGLGYSWSISGSAAAVSLRGGGTDNWRLNGALTASRRISAALNVGATSRILTHTTAAPSLDNRRLYWDPTAFWTNALQMELRTPPETKWQLRARVSPGFAVANERDLSGTQVVLQFGTELGVGYRVGNVSFESDIGYNRGRAGDYRSLTANFRLSIRH